MLNPRKNARGWFDSFPAPHFLSMGVNHMKKLISTLLAACVLLSLAACGAAGTSPQADGTETYVFTDDLGREVTAPAHPERVAAMIGSFADVWCLAGGKDTLVAAADDTWTQFELGLPETVVNLGGVKEPSAEALLAAQPDFVIGSAKTAADVDLLPTLEQAGIPTAYFEVSTFEDYLARRSCWRRSRSPMKPRPINATCSSSPNP